MNSIIGISLLGIIDETPKVTVTISLTFENLCGKDNFSTLRLKFSPYLLASSRLASGSTITNN